MKTSEEFYEKAHEYSKSEESKRYYRNQKKKRIIGRIKITLKISLGVIAFLATMILFQVADEDLRMLLFAIFVIVFGVAVGNYKNSKDKDKKIEQLEGDWRFCKMLLDISRLTHDEDQEKKITGLVNEMYHKKKDRLIKQGFDDERASELALNAYKKDNNDTAGILNEAYFNICTKKDRFY